MPGVEVRRAPRNSDAARGSRTLAIGLVNSADQGGGAEEVARSLLLAYRQRGNDAWLAVARRRSNTDFVLTMSAEANQPAGAPFRALQHLLRARAGGAAWSQRPIVWLDALARGGLLDRFRGIEDFHYPASRRVLDVFPVRPDILHAHNLHGDYFDLRILPEISRKLPVVFTLHDAWLLSGHCAHSLACERWRIGCGHCPDLTLYPAVRADATAHNWRRKQLIYQQSSLFIASPSQWLMDRVHQSMLSASIAESRVIPNGIDLTQFRPGDRESARKALGLPRDAAVLILNAYGGRANPWKDFATLQTAMTLASEDTSDQQRLHLVALGDNGPPDSFGRAALQPVPFTADRSTIARYLQAADLYLHSSRADTFPTAVLEALACGTPVIASAVGGIPEQVRALNISMRDGPHYDAGSATGVLVKQGDAQGFADAVKVLMANVDLRRRLSTNAASDALQRFGLDRQVERYLGWFQDIIRAREAIQ